MPSPGRSYSKLVLVSGVPVTQHTEESLSTRPLQDFTVLRNLYGAQIIDSHSSPPTSWLGRTVDRRLGDAWRLAYLALRAAGRDGVVLAMGDDVGVPAGVLNGFRIRRAPLVIVAQYLRSRKAALFLRRLRFHRGIDRILANSERQCGLVTNDLRVPASKVGLFYDHVDTDYFTADDTEVVVGQVCSAGLADRDYGTLVEAVRDSDLRLKIEANSAWMDGRANVNEDQIHEGVEFTNLRTTPGLRSLYQQSQIVAVCLMKVDNSVGFNTILEGMSTSRPVVTTSGVMQSDFIVDGSNGYLVPPGDVEALRARLLGLQADPALARRLGAQARADVLAKFTMTHYRERITAELARVGLPSPDSVS